MMLRDQYDLLCAHADEFEDPYFFQTFDTDEGYFRGHAQLRNSNTTGVLLSEVKKGFTFNQGIFIDIFALEYTHKFVNHQTHMRLRRIRKFDNRHKPSCLVEAIIALRKRMAFNSFKVWRALSNLFPGQQLRHTYGTWCYRKPRYEKDLFPLTTIKFEGYDFPAPHDSDAYLRTIYGDYMQLPAVEKQVCHHEFEVVDMDNSYKIYRGKRYFINGGVK